MDRLIIAILLISTVLFSITYLLHRVFRNKFIKYIPSALLLLAAMRFFYLARFGPQEGFYNLANFLVFMMTLPGAIVGGVSGLVLDYLAHRGKIKGE
jgi:hypothetical protein